MRNWLIGTLIMLFGLFGAVACSGDGEVVVEETTAPETEATNPEAAARELRVAEVRRRWQELQQELASEPSLREAIRTAADPAVQNLGHLRQTARQTVNFGRYIGAWTPETTRDYPEIAEEVRVAATEAAEAFARAVRLKAEAETADLWEVRDSLRFLEEAQVDPESVYQGLAPADLRRWVVEAWRREYAANREERGDSGDWRGSLASFVETYGLTREELGLGEAEWEIFGPGPRG